MMNASASARPLAVALSIACSAFGNGALSQVFGDIDTLESFRVLPWFIDQDMDGDMDALIVSDGLLFLRTNAGAGGFTDPLLFADIPSEGRVLWIGRVDPIEGIDMLVHTEWDSTLLLISDIGPESTTLTLDTLFVVDYTSDFGYAERGRYPLKTGRFDADALPDIFMTTFGGTGKWYRNTGDGGYVPEVVATNYGFPYDHEGDGDMDLFQGPVVGNSLSVSVTYTSETDTVVGTPLIPLGYASLTGYTGQMEVADIDGNGTDDLVIAGVINLRTPGPGNELFGFSMVDGFRFRKALDLDCDPYLEVLDANSTGGYIGFSIQDFTGTGVIVYTFADSTMAEADITAADIDADGRTDLVYQEPGDTVVHIRWNQAEPPDVTLDPGAEVFPLGEVVPLSGGSPSGGLYLGPGIFGDSLYTGLAGEGPLTITYVYQDPFTGCTDSATAVVDIIIGMDEQATAERLVLTPNPAGHDVSISSAEEIDGTLVVRDPVGRVCFRMPVIRIGRARPFSIPVEHWAPGLYHVSLVPEVGASLSARIMIAR